MKPAGKLIFGRKHQAEKCLKMSLIERLKSAKIGAHDMDRKAGKLIPWGARNWLQFALQVNQMVKVIQLQSFQGSISYAHEPVE